MKKEVKSDSAQELPKEKVNIEDNPTTEKESQIKTEESPAQVTPENVAQANTVKTNPLNDILGKVKGLGIVPIIGVVAVIILIVGLTTFKVVSSSPKQVFKNAIKNLYKEASKGIEKVDNVYDKFNLEKDALIVSADIGIDSNIDDVTSEIEDLGISLKDIKFGVKAGVDLDKNEQLAGFTIEGKKEKITADVFIKDNTAYLTSNLLDEVVKLSDSYQNEIDLDDFYNVIETIDGEIDINPEIYDAILKSFTNALSESLDSEKMEKESDKINVLGKKVSATKYTYELDDKAIGDILKSVAEQLLDDKDFISNLSNATGLEKSDIKDGIKEIKSSAKDIEFEGDFAINVYTRGLFNSFAGVSFEAEGDEYFTYFTDGKNIEIIVDNNQDEYGAFKLVIEAEKDGKGYDVKVKLNKETIIEAKINELSDEVIDIEFEIKDGEDSSLKADIYFSSKEEKDNINGEYNFRVDIDEEYMEIKGSYKIQSTDKLSNINTENAVSESEIDEEVIFEKLEEISKKDETFSKIYDELYKSYEESSLNLDYNDMARITTSEDVKKVLSKTRGTVLYVGTSSYSYGTEADTSIFNNLVDAQDEYDFHTYYLSYYYINDEYRELVKDIKTTCNTTQAEETENVETPTENETTTSTCAEYPVVYFIKDGKVVNAVQGTITKDELKENLVKIGIAE